MYSDGHGVPKDDAHAQELFEEARAEGNVDAAFNLGHGRGRIDSKLRRSGCLPETSIA